jgi:transcriptional regulator with XRE-family HTH domain
MQLGKRIRQLRENLPMSQERLAEDCGVSTVQIYRWETGKNEPTAHHIAKLASALRTTADYLVGREDNPTPRNYLQELSPAEQHLIAMYRSGELKRMFVAIETSMGLIDNGR